MNAARTLAAVTLLGLATMAAAQAVEPGFGFSQSPNTLNINTMSTANPNLLRSVTVTCPANGVLWANATGRISFEVTSNSFPGTVAYALSRGSTSMQANFQQNLFGRFVDDFATVPIAIQRVDSCNAGQTVTYRFLATRGTFTTNVTVTKPALVVSFH